MNGTTHYIKTTFEKSEAKDFELFLRCIKGTKRIITPLFILPSCQYSSTIDYTRHNISIEYSFNTNLYTGFLQVSYSIPYQSAGKAVINEGNKIITYNTNNGFKKKFKLLTNVVHIFPVTEEMLNFKSKHMQSILKHIGSLYFTSALNDQSLLFNDSSFLVHKVILSAQSTVFEKMLDYKKMHPEEPEALLLTNENLPHFTFKAFINMLRYIYTNEIEDLINAAHDLIYVADMFHIMELIQICKNSLMNNINKENVDIILYTAEFLNISDLKTRCIDYKESES